MVRREFCFCPASVKMISKHMLKSAEGRRIWNIVLKRVVKLGRKTIIRATRKRRKPFSRKQLAAQRLFAKRARAGTLRKGRKRRSRNSR